MRADAAFALVTAALATQGSCVKDTPAPVPAAVESRVEAVRPVTESPTPSLAPAPREAKAVSAPTPAPSAVAEWPFFRGPARNGISAETGINKNWSAKAPRVLWTKPMTDDGYAGPASALGMVFIVDHQGSDDIVRAWRLDTGDEVWTYRYPDASGSNYGFSRATPAYADGRLFVVSRLGKVICLDAKTGKLNWMVDNMVSKFGGRRPDWDYAGSPIVDGTRVIVTPGAPDAAIVGLDVKTGNTVFKGGSDLPGYSTPVVATIGGVKQYVCFLGTKICGIDAATGKELWAQPWDTRYGVNAASPLVMGDSVFFSSGYSKGCGLVDVKGNQATLRWQNRAMQAHFSSPIFFDGKIYGTGDPGVLVCMNPADGSVLWRQNGFEKGAILGVDGVMLAMNGSNGEVAMVKLHPSGYQELGRFAPVQGQAWTAPIMAGKKAIFRTKDKIAVVDLG